MYDRRMRYSGDEADACCPRLPLFQGQGAELSHCPLGTPVHCGTGRGGRNGRRAGDRPRRRSADPAAVSPGREGLRGGGGRTPEAHSGRYRGRIFQSGNSLGGRAEAGHSRSGEGEVRHSPPHGLRQPSLLYHLPHSHGAAGGGMLPLRHRHGAEGGRPAHRGEARHPGLRRLHRILPVLRPAGAAVRRSCPLLSPPAEGHVGGDNPAHPAGAPLGDCRRSRVFPRRPRQLCHAAQEAVQRAFLRLPGAGKGGRGSGDRGGGLRCQRAGRNLGIPEFARIVNEIVRRREGMRS